VSDSGTTELWHKAAGLLLEGRKHIVSAKLRWIIIADFGCSARRYDVI